MATGVIHSGGTVRDRGAPKGAPWRCNKGCGSTTVYAYNEEKDLGQTVTEDDEGANSVCSTLGCSGVLRPVRRRRPRRKAKAPVVTARFHVAPPPAPEPAPVKESVLDEASRLAGRGQRSDDYGHPWPNHDRIARMWSIYFGIDIKPRQVVDAMILLKVARNMNKVKRDNLVDIAGYALCGEMIDEFEKAHIDGK